MESPAPRLLADDDDTQLFLAESITNAYTQGVVESRLRVALAALLPNVGFIRLSIPWQVDGTRMMVSVSNLAEEGLTTLHCISAEDSAAAVCVRNAVPCVCNRPDYDDLADAFRDYGCAVLLCLPVSKLGVSSLTVDGVFTHSGPVAAALMVGFVSGQPVTERDLCLLAGVSARMSPSVIAVARDFLPELMGDTSCRPAVAQPTGSLSGACSNDVRRRGGGGNSDDEPGASSALRVCEGCNYGQCSPLGCGCGPSCGCGCRQSGDPSVPLHVLGDYLALHRRDRRRSIPTRHERQQHPHAQQLVAAVQQQQAAGILQLPVQQHRQQVGETVVHADAAPATQVQEQHLKKQTRRSTAKQEKQRDTVGVVQQRRSQRASSAVSGCMRKLQHSGLVQLPPNRLVKRALAMRGKAQDTVDQELCAALEAALGKELLQQQEQQGPQRGGLGAVSSDQPCASSLNRRSRPAHHHVSYGKSAAQDGYAAVEGTGGSAEDNIVKLHSSVRQQGGAPFRLRQHWLWLTFCDDRQAEVAFARWLADIHHRIDVFWFLLSAFVVGCLCLCSPYSDTSSSSPFLPIAVFMLGPPLVALLAPRVYRTYRESLMLVHTALYLAARVKLTEMTLQLLPGAHAVRASSVLTMVGVEGMVALLLLHVRLPCFLALLVGYLACMLPVPGRLAAVATLPPVWQALAARAMQVAAAAVAAAAQHTFENKSRQTWCMAMAHDPQLLAA